MSSLFEGIGTVREITHREFCAHDGFSATSSPSLRESFPGVIPARAGIHSWASLLIRSSWVPAFAGMKDKRDTLAANFARCLRVTHGPRTTAKVGIGGVAGTNVCATNGRSQHSRAYRPSTLKRRLPSSVYRLLILCFIGAGCALFSKQPEIPDESVMHVADAIERAVLAGPESPIVIEDQPGFKANVPAVVQAVRRRQSRAAVVAEFKGKGYLGETAGGRIKYVKCPELRKDSRLHARVAYLILAENDDRMVMYETLARENRLSASGRKRIQTLFHQVRVDLAEPGHLLQLTPGADWTKKGDSESRAD